MTETIAEVAQSITDETIIDLTKERAKREAARKDEQASHPENAAPAVVMNGNAEADALAPTPAPEAEAAPEAIPERATVAAPAPEATAAPDTLPAPATAEPPQAVAKGPSGPSAEIKPPSPQRGRRKTRPSPSMPPAGLPVPEKGEVTDAR